MSKIRISIISYINTIPFLFGISTLKNIIIEEDVPSVCAEKLINNKVDIGLVPMAIVPKLNKYSIITDFCIGAVKSSKTVLLLSNVPLKEIKNIYLDNESITSITLAKILAKKFWNISPQWYKAGKIANSDFLPTATRIGTERANGRLSPFLPFSDSPFPLELPTATATATDIGLVVIGDKTFSLSKEFLYQYDLVSEWYKWTGLPFVFACWVTNKELSQNFITLFNNALSFGINHKTEAIKKYLKNKLSVSEATDYINNYMSYEFDDLKKKGMELFFSLMKENKPKFVIRSPAVGGINSAN